MKKIIFLIILVVLMYFGYNHFIKNNEKTPTFMYHDILTKIKDNKANINVFTIYGKYLNLKGDVPNIDGIYTLVFKNNDEEIENKIEINETTFSTNKYINDGINLEKLKRGNYLILLHDTKNDIYYNLINKTEYHDNKYYTITKNNTNNLITFNEGKYNDTDYLEISIKETKLPNEVYDIVIDPGHGGVDTGAGNGQYNESKFTLLYSKDLKEALEEEGLKVKLTREEDIGIDHYGEGSRTGIPYESNAKLMLSIHLNSSGYKIQRGVEVYYAYQANNSYAKVLADNLVKYANVIYSNNPQNKVLDGVYMRVYSKENIASLAKDAKRDGYEPYILGDDETYYYFIRETGGIMTKAFSDGRNPKYKENIYRNRNQGVEAYLLELGYISNSDDLKSIINNKDSYIKAIKESVLKYAEIEKETKEQS